MSILSPSNLETADYGMPLWTHLYNENIRKLDVTLLRIQGLLDVNVDNLPDGAVLFWFAGRSKWLTRKAKT
jgi:hypothetical protein